MFKQMGLLPSGPFHSSLSLIFQKVILSIGRGCHKGYQVMENRKLQAQSEKGTCHCAKVAKDLWQDGDSVIV